MGESSPRPIATGPLDDLDEWETVFEPAEATENGTKSSFRDYRKNVRAGVREFYRLNHRHQTLDFVLGKGGVPHANPETYGNLGGDGIPQYPRRR